MPFFSTLKERASGIKRAVRAREILFGILILFAVLLLWAVPAFAAPLSATFAVTADRREDGGGSDPDVYLYNGRAGYFYAPISLPYGAVIVSGTFQAAFYDTSDSRWEPTSFALITSPWTESGTTSASLSPVYCKWVNVFYRDPYPGYVNYIDLGEIAARWNVEPNYGIAVRNWGDHRGVVTREYSNSQYRPYLIIYYYNKPGNVYATSIGQTSITIAWDPNGNPSDATYRVYRNGVQVYQGTATSFTDTGLSPGTSYTYTVYTVTTGYSTTYMSAPSSLTVRTVPPTPGAPSGTASRVVWSSTAGRGKVVLNWSAVTGANGYKVYVFDGNVYRGFDVGNTTTWDSSVAKIYPDPNWLAAQADNSISPDPFNHSGGGFDLQDNPNILYRKTVGTTYDSATNYWFRVSAYNESGESPMSNALVITLPNATDTTGPSGSASVLSAEGLKKTYSQTVYVSVSASDSESGIYQVLLSNDNSVWTPVYTASKNPDNSTGVTALNKTFTWTVTPGGGTKTVYIKVVDSVGNAKVLSDSIVLAEDMLPPSVTLQINGGAEYTTSPNVTLTLNVQDNASTTSQMQMRFSNDGNLWSPWEPFSQTKAWDLTASAYGGNTSPGIKKVYAQVCDQAQNVALAMAEIGYNPAPPSGTVTIVGGSSGTWNGKTALFTSTDAPTLNLNFPGATYVRFDPGTGIWGDWETYATQKTVYLIKSSGAVKFRVQVKDAYGVTSTPQEYLVVVDSTPPVIQYLRGLNGATATTSSSVTLEISATDNLPGQLQYQYQVNGGSWSSWAVLSGNTINVSGLASGANRITVNVRDGAGNVSSAIVTIFRI